MEKSRTSVIINLPEWLHQKFKVKTTKNKTTMSDILRDFIEEYVK